MVLEKLPLFTTKREFFIFLFFTFFLFCYTLLMEFHNYQKLTQFDSALLNATILKHYPKTKTTKTGKIKTYQVLKLRAKEGFEFYTTSSKMTQFTQGDTLELEIFFKKISFYEYFTGFYAFSKILSYGVNDSLKQSLNAKLSELHQDKNVSSIYKALYTATPLDKELQEKFSLLGVSHLLAISGFHLGVLSAVLFFLIKYPYKFLQNRYFPYRNITTDTFILVALSLLTYLLFLESPPSLLRAYTMLLIGFILYDRGFEVISMQTLFLTLILLIAIFPRLLFSIGFWLSLAGVFYIFLFLIYFKHLSKFWQFILIPIWVYLAMLPFSLVLFESFSLYHPLSIVWTSLFTLFYPLSIFLHLIGFGDVLDNLLLALISLPAHNIAFTLEYIYLAVYVALSLLAVSFVKL